MPRDRRPEPSPYDVLGVRLDASGRDIARAYRRLARASHPDARPIDAGAAARFRAVSDAYELLSDPARRAAYDERQRRSRAAPVPGVSQPSGRRPGSPAFRSPPPRSPAPPPRSPAPMPALWPLGPATAEPVASRPGAAPAAPAVWPGPVRLEPLPGDPAAGPATDQARLLALAGLLRSLLGDDRNRSW